MNNKEIKPLYTTRGDVEAILSGKFIHNLFGEWIGWVTEGGDVYSVNGRFVGTLSSDFRILRKLSVAFDTPHIDPPPPPENIQVPNHFPLAPLMAEIPMTVIDVLLDSPELLPPLGFGEYTKDMD